MAEIRVGFGYDSHRLEEGRKLMVGGVEIPSAKGSVAHSDGDVLIHALCDALLGAAGLQDLGIHFPNTDPCYKDIDSGFLLQEVHALLARGHWRVNNVDATVVLEYPKLGEAKDHIRARLAAWLDMDPAAVSVKAKTNEKMDAVGSGEGIAAFAAVTLTKE